MLKRGTSFLVVASISLKKFFKIRLFRVGMRKPIFFLTLSNFISGTVLVFVTKKANCEELAHNLQAKEFDVRLIHGDLNQV